MTADRLQQLREGNARFVAGRSAVDWDTLSETRAEVASGQSPFAVVITCSDSRVPAEMVFDQSIGDLFVIRLAGNVVTPEVVGSVEFAVAALGARLVVCMGHASCGAVGAAVDQRRADAPSHTEGLHSVLDRIAPAVTRIVPHGEEFDDASRDDIVSRAIRENARASARALAEESPLLAEHVVNGLVIMAAHYELATGEVTFL